MKEGYKDTPIGLIPEDWDVMSIHDYADILDNKRVPLSSEVRSGMKGGYPYCGANGIVDYINQYVFEGLHVLIAEDGGNFHEYETRPISYLMNGKFWVNNHAHVLRAKNSEHRFLHYSLVHKDITNHIIGSTRTKLNKSTLEKIPLAIPPHPEQSKIASILSIVDDKIDAINERITQTQQLKNGLMQRLLTKGIGHTKFKDSPLGEIPESWEVKKLGEITKVCVGKDLLEQNYSPDWSDEYKYPVYSNTVENKGLYGYYNIQEYNGNSVTVIGRGVGVGTAFPRKDSFGAIGRLIVLFPKSGLNEVYLSYNINFCVKFFAESSAIPQLTGAQISKYFITFPPFHEQQKIADIFALFDEKLDVLQEKKTEYEQLKKGLMQQLLPGKIRVNMNYPDLQVGGQTKAGTPGL